MSLQHFPVAEPRIRTCGHRFLPDDVGYEYICTRPEHEGTIHTAHGIAGRPIVTMNTETGDVLTNRIISDEDQETQGAAPSLPCTHSQR